MGGGPNLAVDLANLAKLPLPDSCCGTLRLGGCLRDNFSFFSVRGLGKRGEESEAVGAVQFLNGSCPLILFLFPFLFRILALDFYPVPFFWG